MVIAVTVYPNNSNKN